MNIYTFTLRFDVSASGLHGEELVERLGISGCDDAAIGTGRPGRIALQFDREAGTALDAVLSAVRDVKAGVPGALLLEAGPDFVGITELASLVGCSRQNMLKLIAAAGADAPPPVHEGRASLWHLAPALEWLSRDKGYTIATERTDLAQVTMRLNAAVGTRELADTTQQVIAGEVA